jgi:hypothetical protein
MDVLLATPTMAANKALDKIQEDSLKDNINLLVLW